MLNDLVARRALLAGAFEAIAGCAAASAMATAEGEQTATYRGSLDLFIRQYMRAMNAPGLTFASVDRTGETHTEAYGLADLEARLPVRADQLFQVGSLTKSFVALTLLQLREEGKVQFDRPILEYLPWLPIECTHGAITLHHLLTHTSGLPNPIELFPLNPADRHTQVFQPGTRWSYCNLGYAILGHLITTLDGRPWPLAVQQRIFAPLGMSASSAVISDPIRARMTPSYVAYFEDRVYQTRGKLVRAGNFAFENAAGSIASTSGDMAKYLRMLLNRGRGPNGRVVSEESFAAFAKPYFRAEEFGPTAKYGYGIAVDQQDGHNILRHTGGMVSFMSAMYVDLTAGVAAFASINAMQGYRPTAVVQYASEVLAAQKEKSAAPRAPELFNPLTVENAGHYEGTFSGTNGKTIRIDARVDRLTMTYEGKTSAIASSAGDTFLSLDPRFQAFPLVFGRAPGKEVQELFYGSEWYINERYRGPRTFAVSREIEGFAGHYRGDSAWITGTHILLRKGKLVADSIFTLEPLGGSLFRMGETNTVEFSRVVDGKAQVVNFAGASMRRMEVA